MPIVGWALMAVLILGALTVIPGCDRGLPKGGEGRGDLLSDVRQIPSGKRRGKSLKCREISQEEKTCRSLRIIHYL